jgi:hypothetical protein
MIGLVAGLAFTAWRKSIRSEIDTIRELIDSENALDEEHRVLAMRIVNQYEKLGYTGQLLNKRAYDTMCVLCASRAKAQQFPEFYASLSNIRQTLRCVSFGTSDAYV